MFSTIRVLKNFGCVVLVKMGRLRKQNSKRMIQVCSLLRRKTTSVGPARIARGGRGRCSI